MITCSTSRKKQEEGFQVKSNASLGRCSRIPTNLASFHMKQIRGNAEVKETRKFFQELQNLNKSQLYPRNTQRPCLVRF